MITLREKQVAFCRLSARLIDYAFQHGDELTFSETYRPPETAELYAQQGRGSRDSLHCVRLAVDLNLFRNGTWLKRSEDFAYLGAFWKAQSTGDYECCWGGDFDKPDGNHFSIAHEGRR